MKIIRKHAGFNRNIITLALLASFGHAYAAEPADPAQPASSGGMESANPAPAGKSMDVVQPANPATVASTAVVSAKDNPNIAHPIVPASTVSMGVDAISGNSQQRSLFDQYRGFDHKGSYLLLNADITKHDDDTAIWTTFQTRNLGLEDGEAHFMQRRYADWKYSVDYTELVHNYPRTINTGDQGLGTVNPTVVLLAKPGTGEDLNIGTTRKNISISGDKWLNPSFQLFTSFKNENKDGAQMFGKGFECNSAIATQCVTNNQYGIFLLPEPINFNTQQYEAKLNYAGEKLSLNGGYYGSFFTDGYGSLKPNVPSTLDHLGSNTPTTLNASLVGLLNLPVSLPPDNQAQQLFLDGTYGFTSATRATFKYAFTHATQNENFANMGFINPPPGGLDGAVDTTLAQAGLTSRPTSKLSTVANVRYENRNDKTAINSYDLESGKLYPNSQQPLQQLNGKLEASYVLPKDFRATLGSDYEWMDYGDWAGTDANKALTALRQTTKDLGWRAELRRSMFETLSGAIAYSSSRRSGGSWLSPNTPAQGLGTTPVTNAQIYSATGIFPLMFMDRTTNKVTASADWEPVDRLSLQFMVSGAHDYYHAPTTSGLSSTGAVIYDIDADYTLSNMWKMTGYWSKNNQDINTIQSSSGGYIADLTDQSDTVGLKVTGKPTSQLELGADLSYLHDVNGYGQGSTSNTCTPTCTQQETVIASGGLPEVTYVQTTLKLYSKYALEKNADVRLDFLHQRASLKEWTWGSNGVPYTYSDNTTVYIQPNQKVTLIGATYIYKF